MGEWVYCCTFLSSECGSASGYSSFTTDARAACIPLDRRLGVSRDGLDNMEKKEISCLYRKRKEGK
jgi:hypothetical protein